MRKEQVVRKEPVDIASFITQEGHSAELKKSFSTPEQPIWQQRWWKAFDIQIGIVPLPLFILAAILIAALCLTGTLPSEITTMVVVLAFFGFICAEIGKRVPVLNKIGGAAICATFIPSALVYYHWLPQQIIDSTITFNKQTGILYLYIASVIVGSIFSLDRRTILQGFMRIVIPMFCGEVIAAVIGTAIGTALGLGAFHTLFFIILPMLGGGVGAGAIPLSIGFASIMHLQQGEVFAEIIPMVMLGSLVSILTAGVLNHLGKKKPHLTGEGRLLPVGQDDDDLVAQEGDPLRGAIDVTGLAVAAMMILTFYMLGIWGQRICGIPAPVGMVFVAVIIKLMQLVPPRMTNNANIVYKFFQKAGTAPILFMMGVAITPWNSLIAAFTIPNLIVIVATVLSLALTGFFVGKKLGMYPIDTSVISCCQSAQGGTGAVAILSAANRMSLMPFAQIATHLGGAINVTVALIFLAHYL